MLHARHNQLLDFHRWSCLGIRFRWLLGSHAEGVRSGDRCALGLPVILVEHYRVLEGTRCDSPACAAISISEEGAYAALLLPLGHWVHALVALQSGCGASVFRGCSLGDPPPMAPARASAICPGARWPTVTHPRSLPISGLVVAGAPLATSRSSRARALMRRCAPCDRRIRDLSQAREKHSRRRPRPLRSRSRSLAPLLRSRS